jgi:hypothetical protein
MEQPNQFTSLLVLDTPTYFVYFLKLVFYLNSFKDWTTVKPGF